jgi:hypothetical protein
VTLDELGEAAAKNPEWKIVVEADADVPYVRVAEMADVLNAAGAEFSYRDGRMGDGNLRVASLQASYREFDSGRTFSMCRPGGHPHWFTIGWPAKGERPRSQLRFYPQMGEGGKWVVAWELGKDVIWWIDDSDVGKLQITDPAAVLVTREGRTNNFSRNFALPDAVIDEFRRLGFVVGREQVEGRPIIGGNTGSQEVLAAELRDSWTVKGTVTDADGTPLADVPVLASYEFGAATPMVMTDAKGRYSLRIRSDLNSLEKPRTVVVTPMLPGFVDRTRGLAGKFSALIRADESLSDSAPQYPHLVLGKTVVADFVMLPEGE